MKKLIITRNFDTNIEKVWEAFTKPDILMKWWSPKNLICSFAKIDLKQDGIFQYCFKAEDGSQYWGRGVYQSIKSPNYISYLDTFSDEDGNPVPPKFYGIPGDEIIELLVEFSFSEVKNSTTVILTGDNIYDDTMTDQMKQGWNEMFDKLEHLLNM